MKAMVLSTISRLSDRPHPLEMTDLPEPTPGDGEVLVRVAACGVCHTELDEIEGRTPPSHLPRVLGHQIVGRVEGLGRGVEGIMAGTRVGIAWIFHACGRCRYCLDGRENLCPYFRATGRDADGGYAEWAVAPAAFVHPIPSVFSDVEAAPLLCAGAIGYRSLALAGLTDGDTLGLTGFGASAHLTLALARHRYPRSAVFVFARDASEQAFARELGAVWAGDTADTPPAPLDAIIDTTPAWRPPLRALRHLAPGGRLVINAIRKGTGDVDEWLTVDYGRDLWLEREIKSVANVTRRDVREFLTLAASIPIRPVVQTFRLEEANDALLELRGGRVRGAKVLWLDR